MNGEQLKTLVDGLDENGLLKGIQYMITGYIGSESFLNAISDVIDRVKEQNPDLKYICDPVLGDLGKFYTPKELVPLFREKIIPKAWLTCPNQFEAEHLTGIKITDQASAIEVMQ